MKTLTFVSCAMIVFSLTLSIFLLSGHHFMPTPDKALSGWPENEWRPIYKEVREKSFVKIEEPVDVLVKTVTLAKLHFTGCIAEPDKPWPSFTCFLKGQLISLGTILYLWKVSCFIAIATAIGAIAKTITRKLKERSPTN